MEKIVSITKQGQLTIPKKLLQDFKIRGATKAVVYKVGNTIIVKPKHDFRSLSGSLKSKIFLTSKINNFCKLRKKMLAFFELQKSLIFVSFLVNFINSYSFLCTTAR